MAGNTTSVQTASLLSIIEQGQRMESLFVNVLLESAMKLSSITDVNIFVMVDTAYGRKWAGRKGLRDEFMKGSIRRESPDEEICTETVVPGGVAHQQQQQQQHQPQPQHQAKEQVTSSASGGVARPASPPLTGAIAPTHHKSRDHSPSAVFGLNTLATAASVLNGQYAPPLPASFTNSPLMLAHLQQSAAVAAAAYPSASSPHSHYSSSSSSQSRSSPSRPPNAASSVPKRVRDIPSQRSASLSPSLSRQNSSPSPRVASPATSEKHIDQPKSMKTNLAPQPHIGIAATGSSNYPNSINNNATSPNENSIQTTDAQQPTRTRSPLVGSQKRKRRPSFSSVLNVQQQPQQNYPMDNNNKSPRVLEHDASRSKPNLDIVKTKDNGTDVYVVKKTSTDHQQGGAINLSTKTSHQEEEIEEPGSLVIAEDASPLTAAYPHADSRDHGDLYNEALMQSLRARAAEAAAASGEAPVSDGEDSTTYESIYSGGTLDYSQAIAPYRGAGSGSPSKMSDDGYQVRVTHAVGAVPGAMDGKNKKIVSKMPSSPEAPQSPIDQAEIMKLVMMGVPEAGGGFSCHICQLKVGNRNRLKQHIESVHLQLRLFECPDCHRRFNRKDNLQSHMKAGHGAPRFNCPQCKSVYRYEHDLKKHFQKKHCPEGESDASLASSEPLAIEYSVDGANYGMELEYDSNNSTTSGSPAPPPFREEITMNIAGTAIST